MICSPCFGELCSLRPTQGATEPKQKNGGERAERRGWNERHDRVPQPFRGASRANGDRSRGQLEGGTRGEWNGGGGKQGERQNQTVNTGTRGEKEHADSGG